MSIEQELTALNAPRKVVEAGQCIDEAAQAGLNPPRELANYVRDWVTRNRGNNRYGR